MAETRFVQFGSPRWGKSFAMAAMSAAKAAEEAKMKMKTVGDQLASIGWTAFGVSGEDEFVQQVERLLESTRDLQGLEGFRFDLPDPTPENLASAIDELDELETFLD